MALTGVPLNPATLPGGFIIGGDMIGLDLFEVVKQSYGSEGILTLVDETHGLPTSEVPASSIINGKTNVTTAGTRIVLGGNIPIKSVTVKALLANMGIIYVGDGAVSSSNGFELAAGESVSMDVNNINLVNIDSSENGEGVCYISIF